MVDTESAYSLFKVRVDVSFLKNRVEIVSSAVTKRVRVDPVRVGLSREILSAGRGKSVPPTPRKVRRILRKLVVWKLI